MEQTKIELGSKERLLTRRSVLIGIAGLVVAPVLAACGSADPAGEERGRAGSTADTPAQPSGSRRVTACATTTQLQDFVKNVGGRQVEVIGILKPNVDPHDYEPTVQDIDDVAKADLIFVHGLGLDAWIEDTVKNANAKAPIITATKGIQPLTSEDSEDEGHEEGDPHVWFDPNLVKKMVANIADALAEADPENTNAYRDNAASYSAELDQMDAEIKRRYDQIPREDRKLVTNHDAFQYLARHYQLTIVGAVIPSLADTAEPTAKQINDLIETIEQEHVKAIFAESSANPTVARQVAQETGVKIVDDLYADTLGPPGSEADTYIKMMLTDTDTIVNALR